MNTAVVAAPNSVLASFIERAARDDTFDVAKFGELLRMQREVEHDQARKAFNRAMAGCQAEMMPVIRSATNKHLGNKYAKLEDIDREMRPIYTRWGFSVRFGSAPAPRDGDMRITCTVAHEDGYFEENYLDSPLSALGSQGGRMAITPVQAVGSTVTYLRRYLSAMVFNVVLADDDDDGEATRRTPPPRSERPPAWEPPRTVARPPPAPPATSPPNGTVRHSVAPPRGAPDADWRACLDWVAPALTRLRTRENVVEVANGPTCSDIIANGPEWARAELSQLLADNYGRFPTEPEPEPPSGELPEVEIRGADKLSAG